MTETCMHNIAVAMQETRRLTCIDQCNTRSSRGFASFASYLVPSARARVVTTPPPEIVDLTGRHVESAGGHAARRNAWTVACGCGGGMDGDARRRRSSHAHGHDAACLRVI
jgi:hypothetical protein